MRKALAILFLLCMALPRGGAQSFSRMDRFKSGSQAVRDRFTELSGKRKEKFAAFHEANWERFGAKPPIPIPTDWKTKPVPYDNSPVTTKNIPVEVVPEVVVDEPVPETVPVTPEVVPTRPEEKSPALNMVSFEFYGTPLQVALPSDNRPMLLPDLESETISSALEYLDGSYQIALQQCLAIKNEYCLCDWAYATMLDTLSKECFEDRNDATLFLAYLYMQSGYNMLLGKESNTLFLLFSCKGGLLGRGYFEIGEREYYAWGCQSPDSVEVLLLEFPEASDMDMDIRSLPRLDASATMTRSLKSTKGSIFSQATVNSRLVEFYNDYPRFYNTSDPITRWAVYANTPVEDTVRASLYRSLEKQLSTMSRIDGLQELLYFVQTSFEYRLDDEIWGEDRPFFAEESLYYDYCDCEDRSILFSRLVRDLLGMQVILVYYPGHLATAVKVGEKITGDFISLSDGEYIICDPTYIGAPIGVTMPQMDNTTAKVIMLKE